MDKSFLKREESLVESYARFWSWFHDNSDSFFETVKSGENIEKGFFQELTLRLNEVKDDIYFLAGMKGENAVELVFTPDGVVKNIVFVEELVKSAPVIPRWRFMSLKQESNIEDTHVQMKGYIFDRETLSFYSNEDPDYPDEIDITIIHKNYKDKDKDVIMTGTFIFLDNYLGELNFINMIDQVNVVGEKNALKEPVPAEKLKSYLAWREKEFQEKYEGTHHDTRHDQYVTLEGIIKKNKPIIAIVNSTLLEWNSKASHPWILRIGIQYRGDSRTGLPDDSTYLLMDDFEESVAKKLVNEEDYLNIGRQTADNIREIYYACKEFRQSSKVLFQLIKNYTGKLNIAYDIYKDKYWRSMDQFKRR